ncbi:MAG: DUF3237 family protein [Lachnospiraceae bacterium]|nr:DUF3237 family protein [Lachnospiraceae bacterium]
MNEIFDITIFIQDVTEVKAEDKMVKMISFSGNCNSQYFQGEILPGGIDTQVIQANGKGTLSARYMMRGIDSSKASCCVFVENNGVMAENGEIETIPKIVTDSKELAWLQNAPLHGKLVMEKGALHVKIYVN